VAEDKLIKLPPEALPDIEELTGDMRIVAEIVGVEKAMLLGQLFHGTPIRLWNTEKFLRRHRDRLIIQEYDQGASGIQLARKYNLCERHVWRILGKYEEDTKQLSLWG